MTSYTPITFIPKLLDEKMHRQQPHRTNYDVLIFCFLETVSAEANKTVSS